LDIPKENLGGEETVKYYGEDLSNGGFEFKEKFLRLRRPHSSRKKIGDRIKRDHLERGVCAEVDFAFRS